MFWKLFHWHKFRRSFFKSVQDKNGKKHELKITIHAWARSWNIEEVWEVFKQQIQDLEKDGWTKEIILYYY